MNVITALSTIEHGYDRDKLLGTAMRLLALGGVLLLTTDYCENKVDVPSSVRLFGLPYMVFSKDDVQDLIRAAGAFGLKPVGEICWESSKYPIEWLGYRMTFIFIMLRKIHDTASGLSI